MKEFSSELNDQIECLGKKIKKYKIFQLLSNLVGCLAEAIYKINSKDCNCFHEYESVNDNFIKYKCLCCKKNYSNNVEEISKKRFKSTCKFSNNDVCKFSLLLKK